jgi:hypothetical protein
METRRGFITTLVQLCLENAIRRAKHEGLKLNDTHELLAYAVDINILSGGINTIKKTKKLY